MMKSRTHLITKTMGDYTLFKWGHKEYDNVRTATCSAMQADFQLFPMFHIKSNVSENSIWEFTVHS